MPLQPSMFDILATQDFLQKLSKEKAVRKGAIEIGVVGMRVDARTRSAEQLHRFVEGLDLPVLGFLRDTQNYVQTGGARAHDMGRREKPRGEGSGTVAADRRVGGALSKRLPRTPARSGPVLRGNVVAAALDAVVLVDEYEVRLPARLQFRLVHLRERRDDHQIAQLRARRAAEPFSEIMPLPRSPLIA